MINYKNNILTWLSSNNNDSNTCSINIAVNNKIYSKFLLNFVGFKFAWEKSGLDLPQSVFEIEEYECIEPLGTIEIDSNDPIYMENVEIFPFLIFLKGESNNTLNIDIRRSEKKIIIHIGQYMFNKIFVLFMAIYELKRIGDNRIIPVNIMDIDRNEAFVGKLVLWNFENNVVSMP